MQKRTVWDGPLTKSAVPHQKVILPEVLFGYLIGPFGGMLASGIFTSILQNYFTDVLQLNLAFLTSLQLISTIFIVAANLVVGQLIERTHALAGKARPWILLSALTISIATVLMFVVPFEGVAKMVWIAVSDNLFYAVALPIYSAANATLIPVATRDSAKRSTLAAVSNMAGLAIMGVGSMLFPILVSFGYIWVETIAYAFGAVLMYFFTVEKVLPAEQAEIAARRENQSKEPDGAALQ